MKTCALVGRLVGWSRFSRSEYFFFRFFDTKAAEAPSKLETTEYYNDKLPDANLKEENWQIQYGWQHVFR